MVYFWAVPQEVDPYITVTISLHRLYVLARPFSSLNMHARVKYFQVLMVLLWGISFVHPFVMGYDTTSRFRPKILNCVFALYTMSDISRYAFEVKGALSSVSSV